jgi:hypothetical protein
VFFPVVLVGALLGPTNESGSNTEVATKHRKPSCHSSLAEADSLSPMPTISGLPMDQSVRRFIGAAGAWSSAADTVMITSSESL